VACAKLRERLTVGAATVLGGDEPGQVEGVIGHDLSVNHRTGEGPSECHTVVGPSRSRAPRRLTLRAQCRRTVAGTDTVGQVVRLFL
jgi:hypothetical protein